MGKYLPVNELALESEIITWGSFRKRLLEIADPNWQYTRDEIILIDEDPTTFLKLPSINPYYSISSNMNIRNMK